MSSMLWRVRRWTLFCTISPSVCSDTKTTNARLGTSYRVLCLYAPRTESAWTRTRHTSDERCYQQGRWLKSSTASLSLFPGKRLYEVPLPHPSRAFTNVYPIQIIFLATIGTVAWASNWSFRSFRNNRLNQGYAQHDYPPPPSYNPNMHGQPLHLQQNPAYGFYGQQDPRASPTKNYTEREDAPLMIEHTRPMDFVTERSRERETHLRTPSPSKRMHRQFA